MSLFKAYWLLTKQGVEEPTPYRLFWFEEPTQPDDIEALGRVRAANPPMDIAMGGDSMTSGASRYC
ncbi:MAG: hypothetical protein M1118_13080 [Chloroflexi bacterium]|nr:hypothetical protein [Chloroflexota bacterium]